MIMTMDGGMSRPRLPAPASEPMARPVSYRRSVKAVAVILPTVAVVAVLDPLTAANRVQPATLVWRRRPGTASTSGDRPRNRRSEISVRKMISPIHANIGMAASSQVLALRQTIGWTMAPIRSRGKSTRK